MANSKKIWAVVVVVIIAVVLGIWLYKTEKPFDPSVDTGTFTKAEQFDDYYKNLSEVYKKDTYGGKTPEETLQLFIDALKKGDTDLAAKYYIPEKQKKELESLLQNKAKGFLETYIKIIDSKKTGVGFVDNLTYEFDFFDENNKQVHTGRLTLNNSTKIWKIESL